MEIYIMSGIQQSFLLVNLNKITRDYNSNAEGNTPILNSIFAWFDKDQSGTFDDDEWAKKEQYTKSLQEKLNSNNENIGNELSFDAFPDNVSDEDKKSFLELLKKEQSTKQKEQTLPKDKTNVYKQTQAYRESSNPYYKQYKEIEQKYYKLRAKEKNLTTEEANLLAQLPQIMRQLKNASFNMTSQKAQTSTSSPESASETESNNAVNIVYEEKGSYNKDGDTEELSDEHSVALNFGKGIVEGFVTGSETEKYNKDGKTEHEGFFTMGAKCTTGKFIFTPQLDFSGTDVTKSWTPSVGVSYIGNTNSLNFKASRAFTTVKEQADYSKNQESTSKTTCTTNLDLEWQKSFKNGMDGNLLSSVKFDKNQGNEYILGVGVQTPILKNRLAKHNMALTTSGNLEGSYNDMLKAKTITPTVSAAWSYNKDDFSAGLSMMENLSVVALGEETAANQMFITSGEVGYKRLSFKAEYSSTQNSLLDMKTVNTAVSYETPKIGTFSLAGSITNTTTADVITGATTDSGKTTNKGYNISFGYSTSFDTVAGWFTPKKKK